MVGCSEEHVDLVSDGGAGVVAWDVVFWTCVLVGEMDVEEGCGRGGRGGGVVYF